MEYDARQAASVLKDGERHQVVQHKVMHRDGGRRGEDDDPIRVNDQQRQPREIRHVEIECPGAAVGDQKRDLRDQDNARQGTPDR